MITIKAMNETDISVEDGVITISQMSSHSYSTSRISIPVVVWDFVKNMVEEEMAKPVVAKVEE